MDEVTFQQKLGELMAQIDTLPEGERDRLRALAAETRQRHADIKKSVDSMQENIDFLRLWIKYLLFDLEATRRENSYLRKMLEQDPGPNNSNNSGNA
ncbi:MAG: transcriptional regulator [Phycisphaerales bacterium]|nr:transcriptional regulator [Phycisphaerales bacterium]